MTSNPNHPDDQSSAADNHSQSKSYSATSQPQFKKRRLDDEEPSKLPVCKHKDAFNRLITENHAVLIVGETGSGKTTQIPKWCVDYCRRNSNDLSVACTQPRRIAAMSVAARVAKEINCKLGTQVGYSVRFEQSYTSETRLKYLTDGMLLREAMLDDMLSAYGVIILDEAHERTLQTEILFGVVKRIMSKRNYGTDKKLSPLKLIVMSATMNVKLFRRYLNCPLLSIEGRQHPVQDMFTELPQSDLFKSTLTCVFQLHRTNGEGDILVFCSGQDEIQSLVKFTLRILKQAPEELQNLVPLPLYASLQAEDQLKIFEVNKVAPTTNGFSSNNGSTSNSKNSPVSFTRRVIFATNVAETSVTIPNIKFVIDTGKVKCRTYFPKTGIESLKVTNISKAQAKQRSGRAGRVGPGTCCRLYTSEEFSQMSDHLPPEIRRCSLDSVLLQLISIGINNIASFEFLERPDGARIKAALSNLLALKAIKVDSVTATNNVHNELQPVARIRDSPTKREQLPDDLMLNLNYELTNLGKRLSAFPLNPSMSRIIIAANELGCLDEAITVVALLSIDNLFQINPGRQNQAESMIQKFHSNEGDIVMYLKVFKAFNQVKQIIKSGRLRWCNEHSINTRNLKVSLMIRKQLIELCANMGMTASSCGQDTSILRRALTYGLFNNVATMYNGKYRNKSCDELYIHPSSCLFKVRPESILYAEIVETNKCYMRICTLVDQNWVREVSSSNLNLKT